LSCQSNTNLIILISEIEPWSWGFM
jgi:hypothetical protein